MQPPSRRILTRSHIPKPTPLIRPYGPHTPTNTPLGARPRHPSLDLTRLASAMADARAKAVYTEDACPPAGPYSQAISTPHAIYVSGQLPALPDGTLPPGSIGSKTALCITNLSAILQAAGSSLGKVVKMTVFLTDMADFGEMNAEYEKHFGEARPARSCVAVRELPKGVVVEMECVALP